jgi:hypothetical protein
MAEFINPQIETCATGGPYFDFVLVKRRRGNDLSFFSAPENSHSGHTETRDAENLPNLILTKIAMQNAWH